MPALGLSIGLPFKSGAAAAFSPSDISDLALWLDADTLSGSHNDAVAQWPDLSGNAYHAEQSTAAAKPTIKTDVLMGHKVVSFDGGDWLVAPLWWSSGALTCVWLAQKPAPTGANAGAYVAIGTDLNGVTLYGNFNEEAVLLNNVWYGACGTLSTDYAIRSYCNGPSFTPVNRYWIQGAEVTPGGVLTNLPANATGSGTIGARYEGAAFTLLGSIAEVLWFNKLLTRDERTKCEDYLAQKWGVAFTAENLIICDGDSITLGVWGSEQANGSNSYPSQLQSSLGAGNQTKNFGVGSQTLAQMEADAATQIDAPHYSSVAPSILVQNGGINDIYSYVNGGASAASAAASVIADWETYVLARKAVGWRVISMTVMPVDPVYWTADMETARGLVNMHIRASTIYDALADCAAAPELDDPNDATYYQADTVHPTIAGNAVLAALVESAILSL